MSELRANTISDAAGTGPVTLTGQYASKAWVNFNGTGTVAIRESGNVSSITDNGTGDYTQNVTSSFANANYNIVFGSGNSTDDFKAAGVNTSGGFSGSLLTYTSTSVRLGDNRDDHTYLGTTCMGSLA